MGKFTGVLLCSDYDNTLLNTERAFLEGREVPEIPQRNREALAYFMDNGGLFALATGRAVAAMERLVDTVPLNAPCVVANGAAIYDFQRRRYVDSQPLPDAMADRCQAVLDRFPDVAVEAYSLGSDVYGVQTNRYTRAHEGITRVPVQERANMADVPRPLIKAMFQGDRETLERVKAYLSGEAWIQEGELLFTGRNLLELTAKGAAKGAAVRRLAALLGIAPERVYCAGDQDNDLSMLSAAAQGFAPRNSAPAVLSSGAVIVSDVDQGAVADIVEYLDRQYGEAQGSLSGPCAASV